MANGRNSGRKGDSGRDSGGFVALPWSVLDSASYARLSHPARALLLEFARQFVRDNNGRLLASRAYLKNRGWHSADVIQRAKDELLRSGFIFETVKGQRPNRAAWYAVTWRMLDRHPGYDSGVTVAFERGAYKNAPLSPSNGTEKRRIAPSNGTEKASPVPSDGTIRPVLDAPPVPSNGHHLDMPSAGVGCSAVGAVPDVGDEGRPLRKKRLAPRHETPRNAKRRHARAVAGTTA